MVDTKSKTTRDPNRGPEKCKGDCMQTVGGMMFLPMHSRADEIHTEETSPTHSLSSAVTLATYRGSTR
jgi:hypothetical protein